MQWTVGRSVPASSFRRSESKTPRKPASVFPLPVGEVSKMDLRSRIAGTQRSCACVKSANLARNHFARRGCNLFARTLEVAAFWRSMLQFWQDKASARTQTEKLRVASRQLERAIFTRMHGIYFVARYKPHPDRTRVWKAIA